MIFLIIMKNKRIIFILGGARSGKSSFALKLAQEFGRNITFVATAEAKDKEMHRRIRIHRKTRPKYFKTIEEPCNVEKILPKINSEVVIIDCITLLLSNLLCKQISQKDIEKKINKLIAVLKKSKFTSILVANEVGLGIVPINSLARDFRDISGRVNQAIAQTADKVYFLISGIPMEIKNE